MLATMILATAAACFSPLGDAPELGRVEWRRDYDAACRDSAQTGRPILVLFQEVPG